MVYMYVCHFIAVFSALPGEELFFLLGGILLHHQKRLQWKSLSRGQIVVQKLPSCHAVSLLQMDEVYKVSCMGSTYRHTDVCHTVTICL
jgi:hypothetical protein